MPSARWCRRSELPSLLPATGDSHLNSLGCHRAGSHGLRLEYRDVGAEWARLNRVDPNKQRSNHNKRHPESLEADSLFA